MQETLKRWRGICREGRNAGQMSGRERLSGGRQMSGRPTPRPQRPSSTLSSGPGPRAPAAYHYYGRVAAEAECRCLVSDAGDDACGAQRDVHNSITTREMRAALVRGLVASVLLVLPSASRASERRCT